MEPNNFDDFIRSNSKNDLPVPTELDWENMDFTLPPAKRKPRILPWMIFLLIGTLGTGSGIWYVFQRDITQSQTISKNDSIDRSDPKSTITLQKENKFADIAPPQDAGENAPTLNNTTTQENTVTRNNSTNQDNTIIRNNATNQENPVIRNNVNNRENTVIPNNATNQNNPVIRNKVTNQENTIIQNQFTNRGNAVIRNNATNQDNPVIRNKVANRETFKTAPIARIELEEVRHLSMKKAASSNYLEYPNAEMPNQTPASQLDGTEKTNQSRLQLLKPSALQSVLPVDPIRSKSLDNHLAGSPKAQADPNPKPEKKSIAMFLSIGTNKARMNHNNASLNGAVTPAWGNNFQLLFERELKNNWLVSVGLGYQRLHTTFNFEKDLGTSFNASLSQVIRKTRVVFHNNYIDQVSLNLGGGKQFKLSPGLDAQFMIYISPTRRLSYTGRSLDDSGAVVMFDPNPGVQKQWLLNADAGIRLSYKLRNTDLIMGLNLSQSLTKSDLQSVGNSRTTVQPRTFGLNLGIRRTLGFRRNR